MIWIIQKNLINNAEYWKITTALDDAGVAWKPIEVIPFSDELLLPDGVTNPCVFYGSTSLQRLVRMHPELTPGVWAGPNFDYMVQIEKFGPHMLNHDATVYAFKDIPKFEGTKFIRPVHDTKAFTGMLVGGDEFETWQNQVLGAHIHMFEDTPTLVTSPKFVRYEFRFFVVNKQVVAGSLYHVDDRLVKRSINRDNPLDNGAWEFAQERVNHWQPADAFVMDIGVLENENGSYDYKIVEINSFNCSGIYECDLPSIINAVSDMYT